MNFDFRFAYLSLLKYAKQLLFVRLCDMLAGIRVGIRKYTQNRRSGGLTDRRGS